MKITNKLIGIALTAIAAGALVACTNELKDPNGGNAGQGLRLAKNPDVIAWSGKHYLTNTKSVADLNTVAPALAQNIVTPASTNAHKTRALGEDSPYDSKLIGEEVTEGEGISGDSGDGFVSWIKVKTTLIDKEREEALIDEKLPEQGDNIAEFEDVDFDFLFYAKNGDITFELFPFYCQTHTPKTIGIFYYDASGQQKRLDKLFDGITQWEGITSTEWKWEEGKGSYSVTSYHGIRLTIKKGTKFGFYWNGDLNEGSTTYYTSEHLNEECFLTDGNGNAIEKDGEKTYQTAHAGLFYANGCTYLGLEDWTDFDFQDLVFMVPDELITIDASDTGCPGWVDPENKCTHPEGSHDPETGYCDECGEDDPCHNPNGEVTPPNPPVTPEDPKCPNKEHGVGCDHDDVEHTQDDGNWVCPECKKENANTECNPCPEKKGECDHSGYYHDEEGYCSECDKDENGPCKHPEPPVVEDPKCPNKDPEGNGGCNHDDTPHVKGKDGHWYCPDCGENPESPCHKPAAEVTPGSQTHSEVEVNLAINDQHSQYNGINDLVAKLSIHVRHEGDVKIFIPIPADYYLRNDDLVVLNTHNPGEFVHGGEPTITDGVVTEQSVTYYIDEKNGGRYPVTLKVTYTLEGIYVETIGISDEVFEYCAENYGDGINFEVWLYMNDEADFTKYGNTAKDGLKHFLDDSTIEFLDGFYPDFYINAFTDHSKPENENVQGGGWKWDCTVSVVEGQAELYPESGHEQGEHLNNSPYNEIWRHRDHKGIIVGHDHKFLWDPYAAAHPEEQ